MIQYNTIGEGLVGLLREAVRHDLKIRELMILAHLDDPCSASNMARLCGVTSAGATCLIDRLEGARLVKRKHSTADRRCVMVERTAQGNETIERITHELSR